MIIVIGNIRKNSNEDSIIKRKLQTKPSQMNEKCQFIRFSGCAQVLKGEERFCKLVRFDEELNEESM